MSILYVMVGVPGSGKSTWIRNQYLNDQYVVASTDNLVEKYAAEVGKTYSEVFEEYMPTAVKLMADDVVEARDAEKHIIWDQTSMSIKSRKRKFNMLRDYEHIAVVFKTPEPDELKRRLDSRPGKNIPDHVMKSMMDNFDMPTTDEGFSEIVVL